MRWLALVLLVNVVLAGCVTHDNTPANVGAEKAYAQAKAAAQAIFPNVVIAGAGGVAARDAPHRADVAQGSGIGVDFFPLGGKVDGASAPIWLFRFVRPGDWAHSVSVLVTAQSVLAVDLTHDEWDMEYYPSIEPTFSDERFETAVAEHADPCNCSGSGWFLFPAYSHEPVWAWFNDNEVALFGAVEFGEPTGPLCLWDNLDSVGDDLTTLASSETWVFEVSCEQPFIEVAVRFDILAVSGALSIQAPDENTPATQVEVVPGEEVHVRFPLPVPGDWTIQYSSLLPSTAQVRVCAPGETFLDFGFDNDGCSP